MANESEQIEQDLYSSKFNSFFNDNLIEKLRALEKKRIKCLIKAIILTLIAIAYAATIIYLIYMEYIPSGNGAALILIIVPIIIALIVGFSIMGYVDDAKNIVLEKLLSFIGDFKVEENKDDRQYIEQLKLFDEFHEYNCTDRFKGKYGSLDIDIQETKLSIKQKKYDRRKKIVTDVTYNIFKGIFIKIPNQQENRGRVIVKRKIENKKVNKDNNNNLNNNEIFFDDFEFSKYYNVYADNEQDAQFLITGSFMRKMAHFAQQDKKKKISLSFENNHINIAIASEKDWFEVAFLKSATNISTYRTVMLEIITLLKIVDFLKFELNIGI